MGFARVQVSLLNDSTLPGDVAMNTFHFRTPGTVEDSADEISALLETFYNAFDQDLSSGLTGVTNLAFFDLEQAAPRVPVATDTFTLTVGLGTQLPGEVALVLSFQGPRVSGFPQARRRGRLFIGPLDGDTITAGTGDARPSSAAITRITDAADALASSTVTPGLDWCVFSPTTAGPEPWSSGELNDAFVTITNGWMDNAFDTVRSRGLGATARTLWSV